MSTVYKKISEIAKKTSGLADNDYLNGINSSNNQNANFTLSALKSYFQTKLESVFAKIASPTFTGTPKAPTAADRNNTTQIATTAFVQKELTYQKDNANMVSKAGDVMSGALKVSTSNATAQITAEESTSGASCALTANTSTQAGVYDSKNSKWIVASDSDGEICTPNRLVGLTHDRITPTTAGWEPTYTIIPNLGKYNMLYLRVFVQGTSTMMCFPRVDDAPAYTQYFDDAYLVGSTWSYARLRVTVDWDNNGIGVSLINGTVGSTVAYIEGIWGMDKVIS